jgi:hypothetical protein
VAASETCRRPSWATEKGPAQGGLTQGNPARASREEWGTGRLLGLFENYMELKVGRTTGRRRACLWAYLAMTKIAIAPTLGRCFAAIDRSS